MIWTRRRGGSLRPDQEGMLVLHTPAISANAVPPVSGAAKDRNVPGAGGSKKLLSGKRLVLLAVLIGLAAAGSAGVWFLFLSPVNVQVSHVERDVPVQVFGLGTVEARVTSKVGFKVSGVLVELRADVGDRVTKGAVLARLDDREQSAQVARAKAAVEQTEANLQRAKASVEKAKATSANATRISERQQRLLQTNSASVEAAETAKTTQDTALGGFESGQ